MSLISIAFYGQKSSLHNLGLVGCLTDSFDVMEYGFYSFKAYRIDQVGLLDAMRSIRCSILVCSLVVKGPGKKKPPGWGVIFYPNCERDRWMSLLFDFPDNYGITKDVGRVIDLGAVGR